MRKNAVGSFLGESRGFGLGFGVLYNSEKDLAQQQVVNFTGADTFITHLSSIYENIIAFFMTQKL